MAKTFFDGAFVWDAHAGFETRNSDNLSPLAEWREAGVNFLSVNVGYDVNTWHDTVKALAIARDWLCVTDGYRLIGTVQDLDQAVAAGEMAVAFDIEGANSLDGRTDMVRLYYDLGVRQMLLAYNLNNLAGGGCHDEDTGLTAFGHDVVAEMNAIGMLVDCSHCGYRTTMDIMAHSSDPVIFSHSNARGLRDHERNIRDDQAQRCAETGGVIGVNGISRFVGTNDTCTSSIVNHIDYYLGLIGDEHVGIGLDYFYEVNAGAGFNQTVFQNAHFWPKSQYPEGGLRCATPAQIAEVAEEMLRRNHHEDVVSGVLGGNFRRVAEQVWK
jgi:membrane dipeptidase